MKYDRILILGCPGSGKTTLSLELGKILNIPVVHMDRHFRVRDESTIDLQDVRNRMEKIAAKPRWIIDGNYMKSLDIRVKYATFVVFFDLPTEICLVQAKERFELTKGKQRFDAPEGMIDYELDESFVQWIKDFKLGYEAQLFKLAITDSKLPHVVIHNELELEKFIEEVKQSTL